VKRMKNIAAVLAASVVMVVAPASGAFADSGTTIINDTDVIDASCVQVLGQTALNLAGAVVGANTQTTGDQSYWCAKNVVIKKDKDDDEEEKVHFKHDEKVHVKPAEDPAEDSKKIHIVVVKDHEEHDKCFDRRCSR
jgi:hypothetical protein